MRNSLPRSVMLGAVVLGLACAALPLAGCGSSTPKGGDLTGISWVLSSYVSDGTDTTVPEGTFVEAVFTAEQVAGRALNSYSGPFVTTDAGDVTKVGPLVSTKMAGPPALMDLESAYFAALEKTKSYYSDSKTLTLYGDGDAKLLVYKKSDATITGDWNVTGYNNGKQAVVSVISTTTLTASFSEDGKIAGNGGVNTFNGDYTTEGARGISIGPLATTMMAGPEDAMAQESAYLAALQSAKTYALSGDRLTLSAEGGATAVEMVKKP
jgi:heat shock protein HslJ